MNVKIFTGIGPEFKPLVTVEFHAPCCGRLISVPHDLLIQQVADRLEEYFRERNKYLEMENERLRNIIQFGNQIQLIKDVANKL